MSFPNIPNITPLISVSVEQTIPLLLSSIALEELALAHIMNAEAEKLQLVLGTLPGATPLSPAVVSLADLLAVNSSVQRTLRDVIKKEMLLEFKFENVLDLINVLNEQLEEEQCTCSGSIFGGSATSATIMQNGITTIASGGTSFTDTVICPNCNLAASTLNFSFVEMPVVGQNDSFTFVADVFNQPSCLIIPGTNSGTLIVTGEGNLTYNSVTSRANFSLQLTELAVGPADNYSIVITSQTDPTFSISISDNLPDAQLEVSDCSA